MTMNKEIIVLAMKNSISDVLETMFFLPVDFDDSISMAELFDLSKDNIIAVQLNFDGPLSGYCNLYVPEILATSITADFLGEEQENISANQIKDTAKEIVNMIVGNLFSNLDPNKVFRLSIPELMNIDKNQIDIAESKQEIFMGIETLGNHMGFQMVILI